MSQPPAHRPYSDAQIEHWRLARVELDLFFENIDLILSHSQAILNNDEYFFVKPKFAIVGVMCNSQANVGTLIIGWITGRFIDTCKNDLGTRRKNKHSCISPCHVFKFGGLLSCQGYGGWCPSCRDTNFVWDHSKVHERWDVVSSANEQFIDWEETDEDELGTIVIATGKPRKKRRSLVETLTVEQMINELQTGSIRRPTPPATSRVKDVLIVDHYDRAPQEEIRIKQS